VARDLANVSRTLQNQEFGMYGNRGRPRRAPDASAVRSRAQEIELRLEFMEQTPLFRGVFRDQCVALATHAYDRRAVRRAAFYRQAEPATEAWVLRSGRVKMTQLSASGEEVILRLIGPGELFGGLGLPSGGSYSASAEAHEESHALCWDRRTLEAIVKTCPPLQLNALRITAERLRVMEDRYRELATERAAQRLSRTLLRLAGQIGRPSDGGVLVTLSREELAQMMGTTFFTVSRLISDWEGRGILRARREAVLIDDTRGLVALADDLSIEDPRRS